MIHRYTLGLLLVVFVIFTSAFGQQEDTNPAAQGATTYSLKVVTPNGGEKWVEGSAQLISWKLLAPMKPDSIQISLVHKATEEDKNPKKILLASITKEISEKWDWAKVEGKAENLKIEVKAFFPDKKKTKIVKDISDKYFSIVGAVVGGNDVGSQSSVVSPPSAAPHPVIFVGSPKGGEIWGVGSNVKITWSYHSSSEPAQDAVAPKPESREYFTVSLSRDGGETFAETIADNIARASRECSWTVKGPSSENCLVKVVFNSSVENKTSEGISLARFKITGDVEKPHNEGQQH
jgi:hypothetical protein